MSNPFLKNALVTAALLLTGGLTLAAQSAPPASKPAKPAVEAPDASRPTSKQQPLRPSHKAKRPNPDKLVNINGANEAELMKLPGITKDLAARIVVGRPYGSKAWLATHGVIPAEVYQSIHKMIIAKQSGKLPNQK